MPENFRRSGALRERMHLQRRGAGDDGWGNPLPGGGPFETVDTVSASLQPLRGTEAVQAARLDGRQPYVCRLRNFAVTRQITTAWQLVDARDESRVFAVTSPPADPDGKNAWLEFIVTTGVPS